MTRRPVSLWILTAAAIVAFLVMAGSALAGCTTAGPQGSPSIRGSVTTSPTADSAHLDASETSFLVIGTKQPDTQFVTAQVKVNGKTNVWQRSASGALTQSAASALKQGDRIEAWFAGPVATSEPPQATAADVVILAGASGQ